MRQRVGGPVKPLPEMRRRGLRRARHSPSKLTSISREGSTMTKDGRGAYLPLPPGAILCQRMCRRVEIRARQATSASRGRVMIRQVRHRACFLIGPEELQFLGYGGLATRFGGTSTRVGALAMAGGNEGKTEMGRKKGEGQRLVLCGQKPPKTRRSHRQTV